MSEAEREAMINKSNAYASKVRAVASTCEEAKSKINAKMSSISDNWKGDSGDAMVARLNELITMLNRAIEDLNSAASQMFESGYQIYNSWPEEEEASDAEQNAQE